MMVGDDNVFHRHRSPRLPQRGVSFCTKEEVQRLQVQHDVDDDGNEGGRAMMLIMMI